MIRLTYGNTNTFLFRGSGGLLVDTDWAGTLPLHPDRLPDNYRACADILLVMNTPDDDRPGRAHGSSLRSLIDGYRFFQISYSFSPAV